MSILLAVVLTVAILIVWGICEMTVALGSFVYGRIGTVALGSAAFAHPVLNRSQEIAETILGWTLMLLFRVPFFAAIAAIWIWVA